MTDRFPPRQSEAVQPYDDGIERCRNCDDEVAPGDRLCRVCAEGGGRAVMDSDEFNDTVREVVDDLVGAGEWTGDVDPGLHLRVEDALSDLVRCLANNAR